MLRSGVDIVNQIGAETTPGTAVAANRFLPTLNFNPKRDIQTKNFRGAGSKVTTSKSQGKKMSNGDYDGVLDYNSIVYILAGLFPFTVQPIGTSGGHQWTFICGARASDLGRKTYTIEVGDATAATRYAFAQLTSFGLNATQDDFSIKGNLIARYPEDNLVLTANPTTRTERPVDRDDVDVFIETTYAALSNRTNKITEVFAESLEIGDKFAPAFFHNRSTPQFADVVEKSYAPKFSFETAHNAQSRALLADLTNNPWRYIRWEAFGNQIGLDASTPVIELIDFDMSVKFDSPEEMTNDGDPYAYKFNCEPMYDGTNPHLSIQVINSVPGL